MFAPDDTIAAIATPEGRGAIGVVRLSGADALRIAAALMSRRAPLEPRRAAFTKVRGVVQGAAAQDQAVVIWFPGPASYTGEDVVEISAHGSPVLIHGILAAAVAAGARLAGPGEFTLRAFLNGKRDLVQAEAVADLVAAATPLQARVAFDQLEGTLTDRIRTLERELFDVTVRLEASLDFPDEGYHFADRAQVVQHLRAIASTLDALLEDAARGRMIREGAMVVLSGRTNVGKSSLFNALVGAARAIVTDVAGTTRDLVTEQVDLDGLAVTLVDTAGSRETTDAVEREGVVRAARAREVATLVAVVLDSGEPLTPADEQVLDATRDRVRVIIGNKSDRAIGTPWMEAVEHMVAPAALHRVSTVTGEGLPQLRRAIAEGLAGRGAGRETAAVSNVRHLRLLQEARAALEEACASGAAGAPEEFLLADLQAARRCFDEVVGACTSEDVLREIFSRFCIGK